MTIALLCPSRRPEGFLRMETSAEKTAEDFTVYTDDFPEFMPTVHKWNVLAERALRNEENKLFMLAADDMIFETAGWDKALLDHYNALENKIHVYSLGDSRDVDGTPHLIVTREYISTMGYFLPPIFLHWFCDSWTTDCARSNFCFTHFRQYRLTHDKPSDKGQPDETHLGIRRMGWHERDKYVNDTCQHFLAHEIGKLSEKMGYNKFPLDAKACGIYTEEIRQTKEYFAKGGK